MKKETTFLIGIISPALIILPFFFYKLVHNERIISATVSVAILSVITGCVLPIYGLLIPKRGSQSLYYYGKLICAIIVVLELVGALLMLRSCVDELRRIQ